MLGNPYHPLNVHESDFFQQLRDSVNLGYVDSLQYWFAVDMVCTVVNCVVFL